LLALQQGRQTDEEQPGFIYFVVCVDDYGVVDVDHSADRKPDVGDLKQTNGASAKLIRASAGSKEMHQRLENSDLFTFRHSCFPRDRAQKAAVISA
jgi:hypothetical protein